MRDPLDPTGEDHAEVSSGVPERYATQADLFQTSLVLLAVGGMAVAILVVVMAHDPLTRMVMAVAAAGGALLVLLAVRWMVRWVRTVLEMGPDGMRLRRGTTVPFAARWSEVADVRHKTIIHERRGTLSSSTDIETETSVLRDDGVRITLHHQRFVEGEQLGRRLPLWWSTYGRSAQQLVRPQLVAESTALRLNAAAWLAYTVGIGATGGLAAACVIALTRGADLRLAGFVLLGGGLAFGLARSLARRLRRLHRVRRELDAAGGLPVQAPAPSGAPRVDPPSRPTAPAVPDPPRVVGPGRTRDEMQLFLDLRPCERCGSADMTWDSALQFIDDRAARNFYATCPACGLARKFTFWAPDPRSLPSREHGIAFGGAEPSQLLDAGEWLWVADLTASRVPLNDDRAARRALSIATAAMEEILKFIPPGGSAVPDTAFWSERGRRVRAEEPGRFDRQRLLVVRDTYREERDAIRGERRR